MRLRRPVRHWFLPEEPDIFGGLRAQMAVTVTGMAAFAAWSSGEPAAAEQVRAAEHEADTAKREVRVALRDAFITPISPEDLFILSQLLDKVLNGAKDVVREAEVMDMAPDPPMADMAQRLYEGIEHLSLAFGALADGGAGAPQAATAAADDATKSARRMEKVYRGAMSGLLELESEAVTDGAVIRELMGRRELYRRLSRIGDTLADVADRVWYASVKEM
jgi:uncharacterized protein Yka (UPF0111/DUF47 family)